MDTKGMSQNELKDKATEFLNKFLTDVANTRKDGVSAQAFNEEESEMLFNLLLLAYAYLHISLGPVSQLKIMAIQKAIANEMDSIHNGEVNTMDLKKVTTNEHLSKIAAQEIHNITGQIKAAQDAALSTGGLDIGEIAKILSSDLPSQITDLLKPKPNNNESIN